jgi:hypothetical protein
MGTLNKPASVILRVAEQSSAESQNPRRHMDSATSLRYAQNDRSKFIQLVKERTGFAGFSLRSNPALYASPCPSK